MILVNECWLLTSTSVFNPARPWILLPAQRLFALFLVQTSTLPWRTIQTPLSHRGTWGTDSNFYKGHVTQDWPTGQWGTSRASAGSKREEAFPLHWGSKAVTLKPKREHQRHDMSLGPGHAKRQRRWDQDTRTPGPPSATTPEAAHALTLSPLSQQIHFFASATRNWVFCCLQSKVFTQIFLILLQFCHESTLMLRTASYSILLLSQKTGWTLATSSLPSSATSHNFSAWPQLAALQGLT